MNEVIACIDQSQAALAVCDYAIWSSHRMQAPLKFLHVLDEQQYLAPTDFSGNIGLGTREHLLEELAELDQKRQKIAREHGQHLLDSAKQRARDEGIENPHCSQRHGDLIDAVRDLEKNMRLLVIGRQGESSEMRQSSVGSHIENVVRSLHRPILITQRDFILPERFLIAFDGSATSQKCIEMIATSPLLSGLECHLLMVVNKPDEDADLAWANFVLTQANFKVTQNILRGKPEEMILNYCTQQQIHLLAIGAYGHSRIRQFFVGSTTTNIVTHATIPVLLLR